MSGVLSPARPEGEERKNPSLAFDTIIDSFPANLPRAGDSLALLTLYEEEVESIVDTLRSLALC